MPQSERFQLQWGEFQENSASVFQSLFLEEDFKDVTLVTEDEQQIEVHRFLLSASSGLFKRMLSRNLGHPHPLIYLKGVSHQHLAAILEFLYLGQVQVQMQEIGGFLQAARDLDIKGLDQVQETNHTRQSVKNNATQKTSKQRTENVNDKLIDITVFTQKTNEMQSDLTRTPKKLSMTSNIIKSETEKMPNIKEDTAEMNESVVNMFECKICYKTFTTSGALGRHRKSIHEGLTFKCDECGNLYKRMDHLNSHKKHKHSMA